LLQSVIVGRRWCCGRMCCLRCHGVRIGLVDREVIQGRKWVGYR